MKVIFSANLQRALRETSSYILDDLLEYAAAYDPKSARRRKVVAECCMDAGRLRQSRVGGREADDEVLALIREHGYDAVLSEAAKHVYTA